MIIWVLASSLASNLVLLRIETIYIRINVDYIGEKTLRELDVSMLKIIFDTISKTLLMTVSTDKY